MNGFNRFILIAIAGGGGLVCCYSCFPSTTLNTLSNELRENVQELTKSIEKLPNNNKLEELAVRIEKTISNRFEMMQVRIENNFNTKFQKMQSSISETVLKYQHL